ncbi:MAG: hypothetical protein WC002_03945 [Candidatus Muiribacteriota bacterium]
MDLVFKDIVLKKIFVENIVVRFNKKYKKDFDKNSDDIKFIWKIGKVNKQSNIFILEIDVNINKSKINFEKRAYKFEAKIIGIFEINDFEKNKDAYVNAALSIMVGAVRSYLSTVTKDFPANEYILPSIDLKQLLKCYASKKR